MESILLGIFYIFFQGIFWRLLMLVKLYWKWWARLDDWVIIIVKYHGQLFLKHYIYIYIIMCKHGKPVIRLIFFSLNPYKFLKFTKVIFLSKISSNIISKFCVWFFFFRNWIHSKFNHFFWCFKSSFEIFKFILW